MTSSVRLALRPVRSFLLAHTSINFYASKSSKDQGNFRLISIKRKGKLVDST